MFNRVFFRFLWYSFLAHIVLLIFSGGFLKVFFEKPKIIKNAVRVDMVGLPDKIPTPLKQPKKQLKKQAKKQKPKKAKKTKKAKKAKKAKKTKKAKKANTSSNIKHQQELVLKKLTSSVKDQKPSQFTYKGSKLAKGSALTGEVLDDFETLQYFTALQAHINLYWNLPQELAQANLRAKVYVIMDTKGVVVTKKISQSSGNEDFDARVLETIQRASPFPEPPVKIQKQLSDGFVFNFPE